MRVFASMGADRNWKVKNSSYTTVQHKKLICVILDPRKSNIHWTGRNRSEPIGMMMRKKIMQTPFNRWTDMILDLYFSSWKNHRWWKNAISSIKIKYLWKSNIFGGSESQFSLKSGKSWNNVPTDSQCMGLDGVGETKASDSSEVRTHNFLLRQQRINSTVRGKLRILERIIFNIDKLLLRNWACPQLLRGRKNNLFGTWSFFYNYLHLIHLGTILSKPPIPAWLLMG